MGDDTKFSKAFVPSLRRLSDVLITLFIAFVGAVKPCVLNAVYFAVFLLLVTWWALYTPLRRQTFNVVKRCLIVYVVLHFLVLCAYQVQFFQDQIPPNSFVARLVGLTVLVRVDAERWWKPNFAVGANWTYYTNFALLILALPLLMVQLCWTKNGVRYRSHASDTTSDGADDGSSVHEEWVQKSDSTRETSLHGLSPRPSLADTEGRATVIRMLLSNAGMEDVGGDLLFPLQRITSEVLDRQKISDIFRGPHTKNSITVKGLQSFLYFCLYHCYVFALLTMLTWALLYHSVFGLVFLVLSCFLWALRNSRKWTFKLSPVILFYTECLLLAQYVYSMELRDVLPNDSYMKIIGLIFPNNPSEALVTLCVKVLLSLPLFVLLRLHLREDFYNSLTDHDRLKRFTYGTFDARSSTLRTSPHNVVVDSTDSGAFEFISDFFIKYWIFVVAAFLLINGLTEPPVLYSLGFFGFFTAIVCNLQISFGFFRKTTYLFLTFLIIYASLVLIAVYSFQFPSVPELFHNVTHLSKNLTYDIGLVYFGDVADIGHNLSFLLIRLILPISLIVVTMLQLKFFHDPWSKLIQMPNSTHSVTDNGEENGTDAVDNVIHSVRRGVYAVFDAIWRLLEVHGYRIILFVLVIISVEHFCVFNFVIILFISLSVCFSSFIPLTSLLLCIYLSAIFVARRVYQMNLISTVVNITSSTKNFNCTSSSKIDVNSTVSEFRTTLSWIGFESHNDETGHLSWDLKGLVLVIVLLGLQKCVCYRQHHRRAFLGLPEPPTGIIFSEAKPMDFDTSLTACLKCFLNYGFYKFGLEISMGAIVAVAWIRMDFLGALLILWALFFVRFPRSSCRRMWPIFITYLSIMFPLQYAMAIGIPVDWCTDYPWSHLLKNPKLNDNLVLFLDLANNRMIAERFWWPLVADFLLLMTAAAQLSVFWRESDDHPAGSNSSIYKNDEYVLHKNNPRYDFIVEQRSFVDFIKVVVFNYGHWITLITVLAAGLGGTSFFALGYLILAFWMLWQGSNLYTMTKFNLTIKKWKYLAYYTTIVMLFKVSLQVFGCSLGYLKDFGNGTFDLCTIEQLFTVVCVNTYSIRNVADMADVKKCDAVTLEKVNCETKIGFDLLAFIFIIFQLRILHSWFFQRCVIEFRCETIQARRGAVLINQLIEKEMREQNEQQNSKFQEIKDRTAAIRKRYEAQQKRGSSVAFAPQTYGQARRVSSASLQSTPGGRPLSIIDEDDPLPAYDLRSLMAVELPAKRAGDYYMFEYDPNTDELIEPVKSFVPEVTPGASDFDKLDPAQLLHAAIQRDLNLAGTLDAVESAEKIKDDELRMIAAVAKSQKEREQALQILLNRQKRKVAEVENLQQIQAESSSGRGRDEEDQAHHDDNGNEDDDNSSGNIVKFRRPSEPVALSSQHEKESEEEKRNKSWGETIISLLQFVWKMFLALLGWTAAFLNRRSREHRYVSYVLNKEKEKLKTMMNNELFDEKRSASDLRRQWETINVHLITSEADIRRLEDEAHTRWEERNVFTRLMTALGNCFSAHTDVLCFFMAAVAHAFCAGVITLPLPLIVFFWGALANPRPSKMFWVCMIGYTEFVIAVKFIFQFLFWPWNQPSGAVKNSGTAYPLNYVLGIQKIEFFALWDVTLLILLFFHRYMMRKLGLWKDANVQDTFAVSNSASETNDGLPPRRALSPTTSTATTSLDPVEKSCKASSTVIDEEAGEEASDLEAGLRKRIVQELVGDQPVPSTSKDAETITPSTDLDLVKTDEGIEGEKSGHKTAKKRNAFSIFIYKLLYPKFRYICDLYPLMFFLDVFCFLIVAFGYSFFGEGGSGDVLNDIQTNRVPLAFVLMLIVISLMIVVDRGLYLRKAVVCKLIYQFLSIIFLHGWIFGILPHITQRAAYSNKIPLYLYIVKCIYFLISAWQIRNGYPPLCIGNLLTHSYGLVNMVLFKVFMIVPFLFELRTAIDWTWTDTSMPLFDFFNMENFYGVIYNLKCARTFEQSFPAPRGEPKGKVVKYLMGLPMILLLILVIWCPLLAFSMLNQIGTVANPDFVKLSVSLEGYPPLYSMEAQGGDVEVADEKDVDKLKNIISSSDVVTQVGLDTGRQALSFIKEYQDRGILNVNFRPESETMWQISKESLAAMKNQLQMNESGDGRETMKLKVHIEFQRPRIDKTKEPTIHSHVIQLDLNNDTRVEFSAALNNNSEKVVIPFALPMDVVVPNEGEVTPSEVLQRLAFNYNESDAEVLPLGLSYNNLTLQLKTDNNTGANYWVAQIEMNDKIRSRGFHFEERTVPYGTDRQLKYIQLVAFADRVFPTYISKFVQGGIIAMYVAVVLLVGRVIRGLVTSNPLDVIISEIPNPDYLLKICLDIYLVREARDFVLEQDLFAKLIFLFRSPATLIKWTRYKLKEE